mgnify:CR=1 FL=1
MNELLKQVIDIARQAGDSIMAIYNTDFSQFEKADKSPLTAADLSAHHIIIDALNLISDFPCLSEESDELEVQWAKRKNWNTYWLIDPLDGTKEFISKNDEFTVNIALIEDGKPVLGVVYCPPLERFYFAAQGVGAYRQNVNKDPVSIKLGETPIKTQPWKIVGSRRHGAVALEEFSKQLGNVEVVSMGSSLKICLVAEGAAHIYPRLAPTCEWDTGAAQAIVEIAGGHILTPDLSPLLYGQKESLLNPCFIVCESLNEDWKSTFVKLSKL